MPIKIVDCAVIEPVDARKLKKGDEILVSNKRCVISEVPPYPHPVKFESIDGVLEDFDKRFRVYYKLVCYNEYDACISCGKPLKGFSGDDLCPECLKDITDMKTVPL